MSRLLSAPARPAAGPSWHATGLLGRRCGCAGSIHACESCRRSGSPSPGAVRIDEPATAPSPARSPRLGHSFGHVRVHAAAQPDGTRSGVWRGLAAPLRDGDAPKGAAKCEEFPGGSTDCEVDEKTGTPTGKVTHSIDETHPCTRPCVEQHEAVHVGQLKTFCPELRDCYREADRGKRPVGDCAAMAIFGGKQRECEAYKVSVPCMEARLKQAKECQPAAAHEYGVRKLASEKCFRDNACAEASDRKKSERPASRKTRR